MSIHGDILEIYADMLAKEVDYEILRKTEYIENKINEEKEKETMIWLCGMDEYDGFGDKIRNIYNEAIKNTSQDFIQKYLPRIMKECEDAASKAVDYARIDLDPYIEEYIECELCNSEFNRVELRKNVIVFMKSFCEKNKLQFEETDHHYNYEAYEDFTISWNKEEDGE